MTRPYLIATLLAALATPGCASPEALAGNAPSPRNDVLALPPAFAAPVTSYTIGVRDVIAVAVFELEKPGEFLKLDCEVGSTGEIALPFVGAVKAAGSTADQLRSRVERALRGKLLLDPQVIVTVKEYRSVRVTVTGAVAKPGLLLLDRDRVTLVEALALVGGLSRDAGTTAVVVRPVTSSGAPGQARSTTERVVVDLESLFLGPAATVDPWLPPGSSVHVPEAESFFVGGYVNRPGSFPYRRPTTVLQAVALAGGLDAKKASASAVKVKRPTRDGLETIDVDLERIVEGSAPDVPVRPGDSVEVGRTTGWAIFSETLDALRGFVNLGFTAARF